MSCKRRSRGSRRILHRPCFEYAPAETEVVLVSKSFRQVHAGYHYRSRIHSLFVKSGGLRTKL